jgi:hypothetical protein
MTRERLSHPPRQEALFVSPVSPRQRARQDARKSPENLLSHPRRHPRRNPILSHCLGFPPSKGEAGETKGRDASEKGKRHAEL